MEYREVQLPLSPICIVPWKLTTVKMYMSISIYVISPWKLMTIKAFMSISL